MAYDLQGRLEEVMLWYTFAEAFSGSQCEGHLGFFEMIRNGFFFTLATSESTITCLVTYSVCTLRR